MWSISMYHYVGFIISLSITIACNMRFFRPKYQCCNHVINCESRCANTAPEKPAPTIKNLEDIIILRFSKIKKLNDFILEYDYILLNIFELHFPMNKIFWLHPLFFLNQNWSYLIFLNNEYNFLCLNF